jgi:hypothetical protein
MTLRLYGLVLAGGFVLTHASTASAQVGTPNPGAGVTAGAPYAPFATPYASYGPYAAAVTAPVAPTTSFSANPSYIFPTTSWYDTNFTPGLPIASSVWPYAAPGPSFSSYGFLVPYGMYGPPGRGLIRWGW